MRQFIRFIYEVNDEVNVEGVGVTGRVNLIG